jgi:4-amino-4-deoxy-L-arabinose transferase-like glycosyltransferase
LSRSIASFMDWFSLLFFGLVALVGWFYWTAAITGLPEVAANTVARRAPGFVFSFAVVSFAVAVAFTLLWAYAVLRAHRNNRRAIVNWAAGVTLVWVLAVFLWLPAFDHRLSYRGTAQAIAAQIPPAAGCIASLSLGDSQRASMNYFSGLRFVPLGQVAAENCAWLLAQGTRNDEPVIDLRWIMVWEGARPDDNDERLRLYHR